jgi:hypothetical protein
VALHISTTSLLRSPAGDELFIAARQFLEFSSAVPTLKGDARLDSGSSRRVVHDCATA